MTAKPVAPILSITENLKFIGDFVNLAAATAELKLQFVSKRRQFFFREL